MALHIRNNRAERLARALAERKGITITQAVIEALEAALARESGPLSERLQEVARKAARLADPARRRELTKDEIDDLWGNS